MKNFVFNSALAPMMNAYAENRSKEGYTCLNHMYYLQEFDKLVEMHFNVPYVTKEAIEAWDALKLNLANSTKIARHNTIRAFSVFAFVRDGVSYVPDTSRLRNTSTYSPHIFTMDEIHRLMDAADHLPIRSNAPLRHLAIPTIIRMLYCCGFRISEVLKLKRADIDFEKNIVTVHEGKGGKDRLVPMSRDLSVYIREYLDKIPQSSEWVFPTITGHYANGTIYQNFRELLYMSNIPHTGNGPRVHDFRHTFAVHTLEKQLTLGYDPMVIMPRLAAYLGHKSYRETCWYLHLTVAAFPELSAKLDSAFSGIIPVGEGDCYEED